MTYKFASPTGKGCITVLDPAQSGLKWLRFDLLRLDAGQSWRGDSGDEEWACVLLSGRCDVWIEGQSSKEATGLGGRGDVFSGSPAFAYVPRRAHVEIRALSALEIAMPKAPCDVDLPAQIINAADISVISSGLGPWRRDVRFLLAPGSALSQRLIIGETLHAPTQWSGWPPHKHDTMAADEHPLEEFYFYKVRPATGFGVQLMYGGPSNLKQAELVGQNDVVVFPEGYHPFVAGPGASCYYLWVLAGPDKIYKVSIDPQYQWATQAEGIIREMRRQ